MSGDYLERLRLAADTPITHGADGLTLAPMAVVAQSDLRAAVAELKRLRADNAALLDGNQRLQTMNDGLRQMAIEAREAANGWHQATIDLYSERSEPGPTGSTEEGRGA